VRILIIGGTRNLGHFLTLELLEAGHQVTLFNRGRTPDELPPDIERLRGDRSRPAQLEAALRGREFEAVVDTTLYNGPDAEALVRLLDGRVGQVIFLSTGQVYLVRANAQHPCKESDYDGPVMAAPQEDSRDYPDWLYGIEKRQAEDVFMAAWAEDRFPVTTLRLPMVNSERDHHSRIHGYLLRLKDGGPILLPDRPHLPLRHVYGHDVVKAIIHLLETGAGKGQAYNISQEETISIDDFLALLADLSGNPLRIKRVAPETLEAHNLIPACSPFSDPWMSELDNQLSKTALGLTYTPLPLYLEKIVKYYASGEHPIPESYRCRTEEYNLAGGV
jgi:nucleoside-diphosphate-sugar epimerase